MRVFGILAFMVVLIHLSCGVNIYEPVASKDSERDQLETARIAMDDGDYAEADRVLTALIDDGNDSNDARVLKAGAELGDAGLDLWSIIRDVLNNLSSGSSDGGIDGLFNNITDTVLGTGTERTARLAKLEEVIGDLEAAPQPSASNVNNLSCFLAGILAVPTVTDATELVAEMDAALAAVGESCSGVNNLLALMDDVAGVSEAFSLVIEASEGCSFLSAIGGESLESTTESLNVVEQQLTSLINNADLGCQDLEGIPPELFPTCLQETLGVGNSDDGAAAAGDGVIASCEFLIHCRPAEACFN